MLYIVGFWHLFYYTDAFPEFHNPFTHEFTQIVLGLFVVISGFLVGCSARNSTSLIHFYRTRLIRIYPLYALAVILFYFKGINDGVASIKSLILISMFYGPAPQTLWFITMLMLFYFATPFLLKIAGNSATYFLLIIAILTIAFTLFGATKTLDQRMLFYFPCFCIGIYCSRHGLKNDFVNLRSALLLFGLWLILLSIGINSWIFNKLEIILMILSCSYLIFAISYSNENKFKKLKIISWLSYSSFAMYLFHIPILVVLKRLYFPEDGQLQALYLITVGMFLVAFISWSLQKLYDVGHIVLTKAN